MPSTPYMNLDLPNPLVTLGPTWATLLNAAFGEVDAHDHTSGNGLPIRPAAMLFDEAVNLNGQPIQNLQSIALQSLAAAATGTTTIYALNGDLYFRNGNDVPIAITVGNAIAGAPGSITNLPAGNAVYEAANRWIRFFFDASSMAGLDVAFLTMRQNESRTGPTFSLTMPTTGMATNIAWRMPVDLPTAPQNYGIVAARIATATTAALEYQVFDDATIESVIVGGKYTIRVKNDGITNAKILEGAVTGGIAGTSPTGSIAYRTIATENIANFAITNDKLGTASVTGGVSGVTPIGKIAYRTIATENLEQLAITSEKIAVGAVTGGTAGGLATNQIAYRTITSENIQTLAVTQAELAANAVETAKIADGAVTPLKREYRFAYGTCAANLLTDYQLSSSVYFPAFTTAATINVQAGRPYTITLQGQPSVSLSRSELTVENKSGTGALAPFTLEISLFNSSGAIRIYRQQMTLSKATHSIPSISITDVAGSGSGFYGGCYIIVGLIGSGTDIWVRSLSNMQWTLSQ